jgi:Domain of unknown function (DUF5658)
MTLLTIAIYAAFAALVLLQLLDIYSTAKVLRSGRGRESNPIMVWFMATLGIAVGLALPKLVVFAAAMYYLPLAIAAAPLLTLAVLVGLVGLYAVIVYRNFQI